VLKPLISGPSMPSDLVTPPPGSWTTGGGSHAGPEGRRPHCGATKTVTGGTKPAIRSRWWPGIKQSPTPFRTRSPAEPR